MKLTIDALACIFHQVNKSICEAVGDYSQPEWDAAEQWQKDATLMSVQFALEHPDATPKDQHDQWLDAKLADGWVFGEEKNTELKTHPCLVDFNELPEHQRVKDSALQSLVNQLSPFLVAKQTDANDGYVEAAPIDAQVAS